MVLAVDDLQQLLLPTPSTGTTRLIQSSPGEKETKKKKKKKRGGEGEPEGRKFGKKSLERGGEREKPKITD